MTDFCIIIQGPSRYVNELKENYGDLPIIWSAWIGEDSHYNAKTDTVVLSPIPENRGVRNLNMQKISTINGLDFAKKLGYNYAIKMRSDQYPTNPSEFVKLFDKDKLTFLSSHSGGGNPYLIDYYMGGSIDDLLELWDLNPNGWSFPEQSVTNSAIKKFKDKLSYTHSTMSLENDVYWISRKMTCKQMVNRGSHVYSDKLI
tara:strand:- start:859 stop:1461 length:603 start_codon:yes stop_codon:yes gene_type:complete